MLGETDDNWQRCVEKTIELAPDSVTIYQMELPFNTTISSDVLKGTGRFNEHVASWSTKRRWVDEAFEALQRAGYTIGSAYTAVRDPERTKFIYRDRLWQGADLAGLGVASFGHINGVHMQNLDTWETYSAKIREGALPLSRALPARSGRAAHPRARAAAEARARASARTSPTNTASTSCGVSKQPLSSLDEDGYLAEASRDIVSLTRAGLLRVDSLLPRFFQPKHAGIRYT